MLAQLLKLIHIARELPQAVAPQPVQIPTLHDVVIKRQRMQIEIDVVVPPLQ